MKYLLEVTLTTREPSTASETLEVEAVDAADAVSKASQKFKDASASITSVRILEVKRGQ